MQRRLLVLMMVLATASMIALSPAQAAIPAGLVPSAAPVAHLYQNAAVQSVATSTPTPRPTRTPKACHICDEEAQALAALTPAPTSRPAPARTGPAPSGTGLLLTLALLLILLAARLASRRARLR